MATPSCQQEDLTQHEPANIRACYPQAMRIPISLVRRLTMYDIKP
jgi:hypothetical protein